MAEEIQNISGFEKKEITYRGKNLEELKKLDIREFAKLLKSNERRTLMRQFNELQKFVSDINKKALKNKKIRTHQRGLVIIPQMVGRNISIYNGKEFVSIDTTIEMLGHRLGEFALTRNKVKHGAAGVGATRGSASKSVK